MGSLFSGLINTTRTLRAFENAVSTVQNNVANASTPNFAKTRTTLVADRFEPEIGITGGVSTGPLTSFRSDFAERAVWRQKGESARFGQAAEDLQRLEPLLQVAQGAGLPGALNRLFQSFSQLTINPNDPTARINVLERARDFAGEVTQTARGFASAEADTDRQLRDAVDRINAIGARLAELNSQRRIGFGEGRDPGTDAVYFQTLEELSGLANFTGLEGNEESLSVFLGGQTLLTISNRTYPLQLDLSGTRAIIRDSTGNDVTAQFTGGKVAALLDFRNETIPAYRADLDLFAGTLADAVNNVQAGGVNAAGVPPTFAIFGYTTPPGAGNSLTVSGLPPEDLAAASPGAAGGNGNARAFAALADQPLVAGQRFTDFYSTTAARVGRDLATAKNNLNSQESLLAQAKTIRERISTVSLDEEAAILVQFQRAYQAASQMFRTIDEMTQTLLNMVQR